VTETERDLADCVGAIYEAAAGDGGWLDVGGRMCRLLEAQRAMLRIGGPRNVLMPADASDAAYAAYFHAVDPYTAQARRDFADARAYHLGRVRVGAELVPEAGFLRSEFYSDFARLHGRRHMIGGMIGVTEATPVGLYRGEGADPFGEREIRLLEALLPHLQRALELRMRLARDGQSAWLTRVALDALPAGVGIVDAGLRIRFVNDVARKYLAGPDAGLFSIRSGPYAGSGVYLAAMSRAEAATLRRLVASATSGGPGGSMRAAARDGAVAAVLVAPAPRGLADDTAGDRDSPAEPLAMVVIRPLDQNASPPADMLCDLFGFSRAEAEVAAALSGGASAEEVARGRGVSLMTVRSQIRAILGKSESENLRDLERRMAALAALVPRGAPPGR
jgi:DNA-binding CsgD family transcriptional regulator